MRLAFGLMILLGSISAANAGPADCSSLKSSRLQDVQITEARSIAAGSFTAADQAPAALFRELPAFCRVVGVIRPTPDSQIGFEVWLPDQWNGRYLQAGNGGFAGSINYVGLVPGIANGFAVASTDDGHVDGGMSAKWAFGHPEKLVDFGYRAVHLTNVIAKQVVQAYYRRAASHTYFSGCSDGGREGLMEAQRYFDDFDGYLVGAPGGDFTRVMTYLLDLGQISSSLREPLSLTQIESVQKAALASCDAHDGVTDGVIENPLNCRFDPAVLQCKSAPDGHCLSPRQVALVSRLYAGAKGGVTPGFQTAVGTEVDQWPMLIGPVPQGMGHSEPMGEIFGSNFWPLIVYGDSKLDFRTLDVARAAGDARGRVGAVLNAVDPNLAAVRASGKKIIQYHGWADGVVPAPYSTSYYGAVESYLGGNNRDFYRLFMAPGVQHCAGGPGPNAFGMSSDPRPTRAFDPDRHLLAALVRWVEKGVAPERIVATKYQDDDATKAVVRTRPLCVWPKVARWSGTGSTDDAQNFVCAAP